MIKSNANYTQHVAYQLKQLITLVMLISLMFAIHSAQADLLKDPTQPPASMNNSADIGAVESIASPILQSVMLGPQYKAAIINGQKVLLGKKYEQATLIKLNEHEAVLRNPDMSTQILKMDYAFEKKILTPTQTSDLEKSMALKRQLNSNKKDKPHNKVKPNNKSSAVT